MSAAVSQSIRANDLQPRPALFLLAAPSSRVNSASWRLTLRQILPANRRLVSVSSTQLPRDERRNYRLDFKHARCGGCTKTRRLQEGFSPPSSRIIVHPAAAFRRAACMNSVIALQGAERRCRRRRWGLPPTFEYVVNSGLARPKEQGNEREGREGRKEEKGRILSSAALLPTRSSTNESERPETKTSR